MLKIIFKKLKKYYFDTFMKKKHFKKNYNHTPKHALSLDILYVFILPILKYALLHLCVFIFKNIFFNNIIVKILVFYFIKIIWKNQLPELNYKLFYTI
jgi:hypothetical protein